MEIVKDALKLTGESFQGWRLLKILGKGLDGIVYLGECPDGLAAVKIFFPEAIQSNGEEESQSRIELQLTLKGSKRHPNLVQIFDGGVDDITGFTFLTMEYIEGESLDKVVDKIPRENIEKLFHQLCAAAHYLETQGLYHRDIKPANIVISPDYSSLTLLDLGIIFKLNETSDDRLSGDEFVASLRYSPPEFVWRAEDGANAEAWRAITFYQIGATLHDLIMQKQLFTGFDRPRVKLYECVKLRIPVVDASDCPARIIQIAKYCLVKNWRDRTRLISWDALLGEQEEAQSNLWLRHNEIRLRQIHKAETENMKELEIEEEAGHSPTQNLWDLQNALFLEIRGHLMEDIIFPKFSATHEANGNGYALFFKFEKDDLKLFQFPLVINIFIHPSNDLPGFVELKFFGVDSDSQKEIFSSTWTEAFNIENAASICQNALLQVADKVTIDA